MLSDRAEPPYKRGVTGSNPVAPTGQKSNSKTGAAGTAGKYSSGGSVRCSSSARRDLWIMCSGRRLRASCGRAFVAGPEARAVVAKRGHKVPRLAGHWHWLVSLARRMLRVTRPEDGDTGWVTSPDRPLSRVRRLWPHLHSLTRGRLMPRPWPEQEVSLARTG
jgi:hypothetical protein